MEIPILSEIVIILGLSVLVILVLQKLKLPPILGFLVTGVIAGPHLTGLVQATHEVEVLAEIGIILLLFIIGLEFSLKSLAAIKRQVFLGGGVQVVGTTLLVMLVAYFVGGFSWGESIFLGFLFSLSSTAIVLKLLADKGEMNAPHGKMALAVLIFQDIIVVPMMLFTPIIAGVSEDVGNDLLFLLLKVAVVIVFTVISARYLVPILLYQVAKTRSKELFILSVVVICFTVAWLTSAMGLSLALGAFLAGLIISESEYSHQATSNILPFREIFTSFFFISIGMLLDMYFFLDHLLVIVGISMVVAIAKGLIAAAASALVKRNKRTTILTGLGLFQVGEFAFILSKVGLEYEVLSSEVYQYFLAISILTMAATPFVFAFAHRITESLVKATGGDKVLQQKVASIKAKEKEEDPLEALDLKDHLVIIGFGINGRNVARAAQYANIPHVVLELNPDTVKQEREKGTNIFYGDGTEDVILEHVNIHDARVVVIAISDRHATKEIVKSIRNLTHRIYIIVRTRFVTEMEDTYGLGADEVIPEEFETSIEIFTRVLNKYLIPTASIEEFVREIRAGSYEMLRSLDNSIVKASQIPSIKDLEFASLIIEKSHPKVTGGTLGELGLRNEFQVNIVAIQRDELMITEITADTKLHQDDVIYLFGNIDRLKTFESMIKINVFSDK
ncbi:MAG: cation:proton antiporter [Cyclobacteriaceae bacterium]|nr:cation:proton antiporter [Cyclobacteriaceae bacterium]MCH8517471.1 cation:proton antiporter [Cyclobacteriaceae bacterium]